MKNILLIIICVAGISTASATATVGVMSRSNDSVSIIGTVRQAFTRERIDGAMVRILNPGDSSLVALAYTVDLRANDKSTDKTYGPSYIEEQIYYNIKVPQAGRYLLKVSMLGYSSKTIEIKVPRVKKWYAPDVLIKEDVHTLGEVTVKASKLKMVMRGDTVVYNADLFQLAEGSMLDKLFQLMPGFEVKPGGAIYVNGKYVESLLVNGKDFFSGDPGVALENLPAYTVKEIKVYNKGSEAAYLDGNIHKNDKDKPLEVDVVLKREYAQGWMANAECGYGTHDVYSGRMFLMRYTDQSRLTIIGSMNNVDLSVATSSEGDWDDNGVATSGRTVSKKGGIDFSLTDKKSRAQLSTYLWAGREEKDLCEEISLTTFLPTSDTYSRKRNQTDNANTTYSWGYKITYPGRRFWVNMDNHVKFVKESNESTIYSAQFSTEPFESYRSASLDSIFDSPSESLTKILTNRNEQNTLGEQKKWTVKGQLFGIIAVGKGMGKNLGILANWNYLHHISEIFGRNDLRYIDGQGDFRHTLTDAPRTKYGFDIKLDHSWLINDNSYFTIGYKYKREYDKSTLDYFRLDRLAEDDTSSSLGTLPSNWTSLQAIALDGDNSYVATRSLNAHEPFVKLDYTFGDAGKIALNIPFLHANEHYTDIRQSLGEQRKNRNYNFVNPRVEYSRGTRSKPTGEINVSYEYQTEAPSISWLIDVQNTTNPLLVQKGNPDLQDIKKHNAKFSYEQSSSNRSMRFGLAYNLIQNAVAQALSYNTSTGVYTYQPRNIDGNWSLSGEAYLRKDLARWKRWSYETTTKVVYANSSDYVSLDGSDASRSSVRNFCAEEQANATYRWDKMYVRVEANAAWNYATSQREGYQTRNSIDFGYGFAFNAELPWRLTLNTTLHMFSRRGYDDDSMNDDNLVWNASLSRPLDNRGHWTLKLRGNDILHQLSTVRRTLNAQGLTETWTNSLPSFFMATLSYKLHIMPKKR